MREKKESAFHWAWKENVNIKGADAQVVGDELLRIANLHMVPFESLTAEIVLDHARDPASPLHRFAEWDDTKAAENYRKEQFRRIIRGIAFEVIDEGEKKFFPAWAVTRSDGGERVYAPVARIAEDEARNSRMISDALKGLEGWRSRYHDLSSARKDLRNAFRMIDLGIAELRKAEKLEEKAEPKARPKPKAPDRPQPPAP